MPVPKCHLCDTPNEYDLANGDYCPVCYQPTCAQHLATVRFRWRDTRQVDSAKICRRCKDRYEHRYWDTARRDWIS